MAGAGYKLFNTGDVLTAAQVNTYLQEQAVMRFANATARTTALSGVLAEGMMSYLDDTNSVEVYNGSAWVSVGSTGDITGVTAGTGLSGGGTSGDVTLSLSTPVAATNGGTAQSTYTTGDILYASASNTLAKRAIGTTGQVLTVSGGLPTWSTPAAATSGLNLLTATTFSAVSSYSFPNSTFTSTYRNYRMLLEITSASANTDLRGRYRLSGTDASASQYSWQLLRGVSTTPQTGTASGTSTPLGELSTNTRFWLTVDFSDPNGTGQHLSLAQTFCLNGASNWDLYQFGGRYDVATAYDSFTVFPSSGTITGAIAIYGYGK